MSIPAPTTSRTNRRSQRIAVILSVGAVLIAALALWSAENGAERGAIGQLSAPERRALYERTLRTLESSCDPRTQPDGLDDFCREQADFIVQFPECDAACLSLAKQHRRKPSR
jgi:hypothetical protein